MVDFTTVQELLSQAVPTVFPAAQLVVVDAGRPVFEAAVGECDGDTMFDLASLTKALVTTTLTMRLVGAGQLALATELRPGVTVRHALAHATGLPAWRPLYRLAARLVDGDHGDAQLARREAIVNLVRWHPLEGVPGTRSLYSDLGFILLGDKLEQVGGERLDEQWRRLAAQHGIEATFHPAPARCAPTSQDAAFRGVVHDENARAMDGVGGHAGLFATARQVSHLAGLLAGAWRGEAHGSIVKHELMRRCWHPCGIPGSTWCLGWDRPSPALDLSQAGTRWPRDGVGHLGFTGCSLWIDPARQRWVVLLSNRVYPSVENHAIKRFRPALHDAIVNALDGG